MPEEWPRSDIQARLTPQRSAGYICREYAGASTVSI
jgi:hypothetical protein